MSTLEMSRTRLAWRPGHTPTDYVIGHARAVLPDRVLDDARIVIRDRRIVEVTAGTRGDVDIDASGLTVIPGIIDTHSDALEKERSPRANAEVPVDFALGSFEGRLIGAGITTVYHGTNFRHQMVRGIPRSPRLALEECEAVDNAARGKVDHRILHRFEIFSELGADALRERLDAVGSLGYPALVSHEDHTPGQGQYSDPKHLIDYMVHTDGKTLQEAAETVRRLVAEAEEGSTIRATNEKWLSRLAAEGSIRILGHDPDTADNIAALIARGGSVAEFPTTLEAARAAKDNGLPIVAGAPNALRGRSHTGNVSAAELAAAGLLDGLASDYLPAALLGGVRTLLGQIDIPLHKAINLITSGPARVAGLDDRGSLEEGKLADFTFLDLESSYWPRVVVTHKAWLEEE